MISIGNAELFLIKHVSDIPPRRSARILKRAQNIGQPDGIIMSGQIDLIFDDEEMTESFKLDLREQDQIDILAKAAQRKRSIM